MSEPTAWYRSDSFTFNFSRGHKRPQNATSDPDEWKPLYSHDDPNKLPPIEKILQDVRYEMNAITVLQVETRPEPHKTYVSYLKWRTVLDVLDRHIAKYRQ